METHEGELVPYEEHHNLTLFGTDRPREVLHRASEVATALGEVVAAKGLFTKIQNRAHIRVEGWTLCGSMLGVFPVTVWTKQTEDGQGWIARVEARTISGAVIGAAEAMCSRSESTWKNRDDYALMSMAQTRATSKAMRHPLGFIVQLAGYDPTPAEEMPAVQESRARKTANAKVSNAPVSPPDRTPEPSQAQGSGSAKNPEAEGLADYLSGRPALKALHDKLIETGKSEKIATAWLSSLPSRFGKKELSEVTDEELEGVTL